MSIRRATREDASALGRVMVESWLHAHRDQIPQLAWRKRVREWTPDVSARGWDRVLSDQEVEDATHDLLLLAEDEPGAPCALAYLTPADSGRGDAALLRALYVVPARHGQGIGTALLRAGAAELQRSGFVSLRLEVLTANLPARGFYASRGGQEIGRGTFDEDGHLLPTTLYEWSELTALLDD